jgi:hypothetical protein
MAQVRDGAGAEAVPHLPAHGGKDRRVQCCDLPLWYRLLLRVQPPGPDAGTVGGHGCGQRVLQL